jgi:conjugal transfer pilus assembly protein TraW
MKKYLLNLILFGHILLLHCVFTTHAEAVDLGVWGESSEIAEEDFEVHITNQLEELGENKLREHQELIKDKMVDKIKRPRAVVNISLATTTTSRLYDPSFIVQEDIYGERGQLFYSKGTKINPLKKKSFEEIWIFIDGDDEAQVTFAKNYRENNIQQKINNKEKKIILINGAPGMQKDGIFFYFDQAGEISTKRKISKVPSIVRQAPNDAQILIEEIAFDELEEALNVDHKVQIGGLSE